MNENVVLTTIDSGVATITLNRPERMNAWNAEMASALSRTLLECDENDAVRVLVLTGAGRAFCAGADLGGGEKTFSGRDNAEARPPAQARPIYPFMLNKPVIAAINGHAVGVGITYPMTCDIRIVAEDAKIAFAFVRRGMIPELASHSLLTRVIGLSNAADLLLSGRTISGKEAVELGLASAALPAADVLPAALEKARDMAINAAPVSVAITKKLLWEGMTMGMTDMMKRENKLFAWAGNQADAREGIKAFIEKRPPQWSLSASRDLPAGLASGEDE